MSTALPFHDHHNFIILFIFFPLVFCLNLFIGYLIIVLYLTTPKTSDVDSGLLKQTWMQLESPSRLDLKNSDKDLMCHFLANGLDGFTSIWY